jgi:hypothetical protein
MERDINNRDCSFVFAVVLRGKKEGTIEDTDTEGISEEREGEIQGPSSFDNRNSSSTVIGRKQECRSK